MRCPRQCRERSREDACHLNLDRQIQIQIDRSRCIDKSEWIDLDLNIYIQIWIDRSRSRQIDRYRQIQIWIYRQIQIQVDRYGQIDLDLDRQIQIQIDTSGQIDLDLERQRQIQIDRSRSSAHIPNGPVCGRNGRLTYLCILRNRLYTTSTQAHAFSRYPPLPSRS